VGKYIKNIPLCLERKGKNTELKKPAWGWVTQQPLWGKPPRYCFGETRNKLKLKVSPREKLIYNSQTCLVNGRGW
jgi:hypothetical protein